MNEMQQFNMSNHSKNLFADLDESFEVGVWSRCFQTNKIFEFSPSLEAIYGLTRSEFEKNPLIWKDLIHVEDRARVLSSKSQLTNGKHVINNYRIVTPSGNEKLFSIVLYHILMKKVK